MSEKKCKECYRKLSLDHFDKDGDVHRKICKECHREMFFNTPGEY